MLLLLSTSWTVLFMIDKATFYDYTWKRKVIDLRVVFHPFGKIFDEAWDGINSYDVIVTIHLLWDACATNDGDRDFIFALFYGDWMEEDHGWVSALFDNNSRTIITLFLYFWDCCKGFQW